MGAPFKVVIHGLPHFCEKLKALLNCEGWDIRFRNGKSPLALARLIGDLKGADLAYTWGGRVSQGKFLRMARLAGVKNVVMLWSGSDIFYAREQYSAGQMDGWVARQTHWAVSPWIAEEAQALGLDCEFVQASFVTPEPRLTPPPADFSVLCYVPNVEKAELYGWDQIVRVAADLPQIHFRIVGFGSARNLSATPNVKFTGWVADLTPHLRESSVLWRPVRHDGLSFMVLEALAQGRHVIYSYPLDGCAFATDPIAAKKQILGFKRRHDLGESLLNEDGARIIRARYAPQVVRANLLQRWEEIITSSRAVRSPHSSKQIVRAVSKVGSLNPR